MTDAEELPDDESGATGWQQVVVSIAFMALCAVLPLGYQLWRSHDPGGPQPLVPAPAPGPSISRDDALAVRALLAGSRYAELAARLAWHADSNRADPEYEHRYRALFDVFDVADPTVGEQLDAWVSDDPRLGVARLARGVHRVAVADAARDGTTEHKWFGLAWTDLEEAYRRDSSNVLVYFVMLVPSDRDAYGDAQVVLRDGLRQSPGSLLLRARYAGMLGPHRRGGTGEMRRFASEAEAHLARNPRLRVLHGYPAWARARRGPDSLKIAGFTEALRYGDHWEFRLKRGDAYYNAKRYQEAAEDYDAVLRSRPALVEAIASRAAVLDWLAWQQPAGPRRSALIAYARAELAVATALDPTEPEVVRVLRTHPALRPRRERQREP